MVAARAAIRPSRLLLRQTPVRSASTTSEAVNAASQTAAKAKDGASNTASKASEGLTKVQSSASSALNKAGPALSESIGKVGGRTGKLISAVQSLIPPTVYYARVGSELTKIVFRGQKMSPPTAAQFSAHLTPFWNAIRNPSTFLGQSSGLFSPQQYLNALRNINRQQLATGGVVLAELLGFFTIGEMIGRFKVVGYRRTGPEHAH